MRAGPPTAVLLLALALGPGPTRAAIDSGFGVNTGGGPEARRESYKTDLFTGAAGVSLPLVLPAGTNGFQPELRLVYSSQRGATWLGRGWDLDLGAISRITKSGTPTWDDDPLNGDRFALGDDRLVRDDAGLYHTMRESFRRIERVDRSDGSIDHWIVHERDGVALRFGSTPEARIVDPQSGRVLRWHVSHAEDANGNFIRYSWSTPTGSEGIAYPAAIEYSFRGDTSPSSPTWRRITFVVEPRPDPTLVYRGGVRVRAGHRLAAIEVRLGTALVTRYELEYLDEIGAAHPNRRSLLHRVVRVGADGVSTLPAARFVYAGNAGPAWGEASLAGSLAARLGALGGSGFNLETGNWRLIDVNGDTAADVVFTSSTAADARVWLNHKQSVRVDLWDVPYFHDVSTWNKPVYHVPDFGGLTAHVARPYVHWADHTGDGRVDLVFGLHSLTLGSRVTRVWHNNGWEWERVEAPGTAYATPPADVYAYRSDCGPLLEDFALSRLVDVNGDGLQDFLEHRVASALEGICGAGHDLANWTTRNVYLNRGDGWESVPDPVWSTALGAALQALGVRVERVLVFDLNGDGLADLAADADGDGAVDGQTVLVNTGRGFTSAQGVGLAVPPGLRPVDLDGDGLVDHAASPPLFNTGTTFVSAPGISRLPPPFDAPEAFDTFVDLDGDGLVDLLRAAVPETHVVLSSEQAGGAAAPDGLLVGVRHAEGGATRLDYTATTADSCYGETLGGCHAEWIAWEIDALQAAGYTCAPPLRRSANGTLCEFPIQTLPVQVQVVDREQTDDRVGPVRTDRRFYARGRFDAREREFRGFGLVTEVPHPLTWPHPGGGGEVRVAPVRQTRFYQRSFLRGAPATVELWGHPEGRAVLLERSMSHYAMTRADLDGTALLQGETYRTACDVEDPSPVGDPNASPCGDLVDLERSVYADLVLPAPLPYALHRARFGAANRDASSAYLVLPIASVRTLYDGDPDDPVVLLTTRWHDAHGNAQVEWKDGIVGDPRDDRILVRGFASPVAGAPPNLHGLEAWRYRQSLAGSVMLTREVREYDGLPVGEVHSGNLTRQRAGMGTEEVQEERVYPVPSLGLPVRVTQPWRAGETPRVVDLDYDPARAFVVRTQRGTLVSETVYDPPGAPPGLGRTHRSVDPNGATVTWSADAFGRVTGRSGPAPVGQVLSAMYDDFEGFDPERPRVLRTRRDGSGNSITTRLLTDGLGRAIRVLRDGLDEEDGAAILSKVTRFDAHGRTSFRSRTHLEGVTDPAGTTFRHDERGRVLFAIHPDGSFDEFVSMGLLEVAWDAEGRRREQLRDGNGRLIEVREHLGTTPLVTRYLWDAADRLRAVCDPTASACPELVCEAAVCRVENPQPRHALVIDYDSLGRRRRLEDPDAGTWSYRYDASGRRVARTDARGVTLAFVYDPVHGRLKCENPFGIASCEDADAVYVYGDELGAAAPPHSLGRLVSVTTPEARHEYAYDAAGRTTRVRLELPGGQIRELAMSHDWQGRPLSIAFPDGETLRYTYDAMGSERVFSTLASYVDDVRHAPDGRIVRVLRGNGTERTATHAAQTGWLERLVDRTPAATPFLDRTYAYDRTGKLDALTDTLDPGSDLRALRYDGLGRLVAAVEGGVSRVFAYDTLGNLVSKDGRVLPYTHPERPRALFDASDPGRWAYDANGNPVRWEGALLAYDTRNRLSLVDGPIATHHVHAPSGERLRIERGAAVSWFLGPDYEIKCVRGPDGRLVFDRRTVKVVRLDGELVARVSRISAAAWAAEAAAWAAVSPPRLPLLLGLGVPLLGALLLQRRQPRAWRPGLAPVLLGAAALGVALVGVAARVAFVPDGDLNADGVLDAADVLLAWRVASGGLVPSAEQLERADVAPIDAAPEAMPRVDPADVALLSRAAAGIDVDADGLDTAAELATGASPFRRDTDDDGLDDAAERTLGTDPADPDSDADGLRDGAEASLGSSALDPDSDGDGLVDGEDVDPRVAQQDEVHWLHTDRLGSVVAMSDAQGRVVRTLSYGLWGEPRSNRVVSGMPPDSPETFSGRRLDAARSVYDFGMRAYDPQTGRFLQPDTLVPDPESPQTLHRYAYARNDPVNRTDPSGHFSVADSETTFRFRLWAGTHAYDSLGVGGFTGIAYAGWGSAGGLHALAGQVFAFGRPLSFSEPRFFAIATGRELGGLRQATALLRRSAPADRNAYTNGILGRPEHLRPSSGGPGFLARARSHAGPGVLLFNPSDGFLNDIFEAAIQMAFPGATRLDRVATSLITHSGGLHRIYGFSQGSLTARNAVFLAGLTGGRGAVQHAVLDGTPSSKLAAWLLVRAVGGAAVLDVRRDPRDPVAALGTPLFLPTALIGLLTCPGFACHHEAPPP